MLHGDSYLVLVRYWDRSNKTIQKECVTKDELKAHQLARNASKFCITHGFDYFVELTPKFGEIVAYGTNKGLLNRKGLFGA